MHYFNTTHSHAPTCARQHLSPHLTEANHILFRNLQSGHTARLQTSVSPTFTWDERQTNIITASDDTIHHPIQGTREIKAMFFQSLVPVLNPAVAHKDFLLTSFLASSTNAFRPQSPQSRSREHNTGLLQYFAHTFSNLSQSFMCSFVSLIVRME